MKTEGGGQSEFTESIWKLGNRNAQVRRKGMFRVLEFDIRFGCRNAEFLVFVVGPERFEPDASQPLSGRRLGDWGKKL